MRTLDLIDRYVNVLKEYNETTNIYSKKAYDKLDFHIQDSLKLAEIIGDDHLLVYDFGSGSGLPSIPHAIANPSNSVLAFESKSRKTRFLSHAADVLGLENYQVETVNIVEYGRQLVEAPDIITAKAFTPYESIHTYTKGFVRKGTVLYIPISAIQYSVYSQLELECELLSFPDEGFFYIKHIY